MATRTESHSRHPFGHALTRLGEWAAHPAAFGLVVLYVAAWLIFDAKSFGWTGATEILVLVMTLFIVRAEFRDTQAIHAKLDKILEGQGEASEEITSLDQREPEEIEEHRKKGATSH
jgi:low affinity Fe/Cu permease